MSTLDNNIVSIDVIMRTELNNCYIKTLSCSCVIKNTHTHMLTPCAVIQVSYIIAG